jgi:hypothetical protein
MFLTSRGNLPYTQHMTRTIHMEPMPRRISSTTEFISNKESPGVNKKFNISGSDPVLPICQPSFLPACLPVCLHVSMVPACLLHCISNSIYTTRSYCSVTRCIICLPASLYKMMKTWESISVSSITEHISRFIHPALQFKKVKEKNNSER